MRSHADPLHWGIPIRFEESFVPIGTVVTVESNQEAVIRVARESLGRYGRPAPGDHARFRLRLCVDPDRQEGPPWPKPSFRSLNHLFHIACGASNFAVADLNTGMAAGFVTQAIVEDSSFFNSTFVECLFYVLAVHHSYTPVHCSGVALGGRGVLICGVSGAGKTTLAYACLRSGMQVLSDDVVHLRVDRGNSQLELWGKPWHLRLLPNAVDFFPELAGRQPQLRSDHEWYLEIDAGSEFSGSTVTSCQPAALVFLERDCGKEATLQPLSAELALERLLRDIYLTEDPVLERHRQTLERLLKTEAYTLSYSGHPMKTAEIIRSLL